MTHALSTVNILHLHFLLFYWVVVQEPGEETQRAVVKTCVSVSKFSVNWLGVSSVASVHILTKHVRVLRVNRCLLNECNT